MTNAVTSLSGHAPAVYHNDHSDPERPKVRTLKEELNRVIRSRLLNPKWVTSILTKLTVFGKVCHISNRGDYYGNNEHFTP